MNAVKSVAVILLACLCGCSSIKNSMSSFTGGEDNTIPPTPLEKFTPTLSVDKLWEKSIGDGTDKQYLKLEPAYSDDRIYVADSDGEVTSLDAKTGKTVWKQDIDTRITGGPGIGDNLVVVGTGEAEVYALDQNSGEVVWKVTVSSEILSAPKISDKIVIVRTIDGKLFGLNVTDGSRLWTYDRAVPALTLRGTSAPVISDGVVIAGFDEGRLTAVDLSTGKLIWETRIAYGTGRSELERMVDIDAQPVIYAGYIYVATFQGRIAAVDLESGRIQWTRDISSFTDIAVDDNAVYLTSDKSEVWALERLSGNSIWKQDKLLYRSASGPAILDQTVVVGDLEGYVHWLDKLSGKIVGRSKLTDSRIIATPVASDGVLYVYASDGTLAAYSYDQSYVATPAPVEENTTEPAADETTAKPESDNNSTEQPADSEKSKDEDDEPHGLIEWLWRKVKQKD